MDKRPIIFLDIDGVLNNRENYFNWNKKKDEEYRLKIEQSPEERNDDARWTSITEDQHVGELFDGNMCARLEKLASDTGAAIVISSSWRLHYGNSKFDLLRDIFKNAGITADVLGPTPVGVHDRGAAIGAWLVGHRGQFPKTWDPYVILDDEHPYAFLQPCKDHLVQTDGAIGLSEADVHKALVILHGRG